MGDTVRNGGTLTMLGVVPTASCPPAPPRLPPAVDGTGDLAGRKRAVAGRAGMAGDRTGRRSHGAFARHRPVQPRPARVRAYRRGWRRPAAPPAGGARPPPS